MVLTDGQKALQATARRFARERLLPDHHVADIREEAQVIAAIDGLLALRGRIHGLVNNAGGQYRAPMTTLSTKGLEAVVRSNLTGGFIFMREVFNRCMEQHGGAIVNIIAHIWPGWPDHAHSGAARGGMLTLSETAACDWAATGVRVNCVAPNGFDTYLPEVKAKILEFAPTVPLQRYGTEIKIASAIVYLLPPAAASITGSCLRVDGGTPNNRPSYRTLQPGDHSPAFNGFHRSVLPELLTKGL